jgi:hypothetical protein
MLHACEQGIHLRDSKRKVGSGSIPLRSTKPSTTGVTDATERPISMTNAVPFPAAKLQERKAEVRGSPM